MRLPDLPLVVLDTETTGFIPRVNRIIEFASVRVEGGKVSDTYETLISIPGEVPAVVRTITRIRNEDLQGKPTMEEVRDEIMNRIGKDAIIVGQNVGFDLRMLKGEGIDLTEYPWIDTSMLASLVFPELESYSLGYVSKVLKLDHEPVHRALGDVNATLALLSKCWERLLKLPQDLRDPLDSIMSRAPEGYRRFFSALPAAEDTEQPKWFVEAIKDVLAPVKMKVPTIEAPATPSKGMVQIVEEPLDAWALAATIKSLVKSSGKHLVAVKNLHATLRQMPLIDGVSVAHPPHNLIDVSLVARLAEQDQFTADEATLATKLAWYEPPTTEALPIHGDERAIWSSKVAATETSPEYIQQFAKPNDVLLMNHWQLLTILENEEHPARKWLTEATHIVIDDASMLEDTATKAYGWYCSFDDIRAGAEGRPQLTKFTDLLQLWSEKTRHFQDVRYLVAADLTSAEGSGLLSQLDALMNGQEIPVDEPLRRQLAQLQNMLDPNKLAGRIAFIETRQNGSQYLQSVPERIGELLNEYLYSKYPTTLFVPPESATTLREIIPRETTTELRSGVFDEEISTVPLEFSGGKSIEEILKNPPEGKTVFLATSRGKIEEAFVKFTEELEAKDITLICQNFSGGMGRMQAEFDASTGTTVWMLTPWSFESVELQEANVDHLIIESLPFDHPSHTILSKRCEHYQDPFSEYSLPRLQHRLFRLLRIFSRYRAKDGDVIVLDPRLDTKKYGKEVWQYLQKITGAHNETPKEEPVRKTKAPPKKSDDVEQLTLL